MRNGRAPRALTIALSIALALAICLGAAAAIAPGNPMNGFAAVSTKPTATQTPLPEAVLGAVATPSPDDEVLDETADDEVLAGDENDAVIENPTEEEQFLTDLMNELDVNETNALEKVNGMTHILLVGIDARHRRDRHPAADNSQYRRFARCGSSLDAGRGRTLGWHLFVPLVDGLGNIRRAG